MEIANPNTLLKTEWRKNMRKAEIREETHYVVDMYDENNILVESRPIVGHSRRYAEDCAENWEIGVIQNDNKKVSNA